MRAGRYAGTLLSRSAVAALVALAVAAAVLSALGVARAQATVPPNAPSISSVTVGDRQLTVNWNAATTPGDKPVVDYQVQYRAGSSGDWSTASSYSIVYESPEQTGSDTTWAHNRNPLDLGVVTGDAAAYIERTKGGRHNLDGVYRLKQAVAAVKFTVSGTTDGAGTLRSNYTKSPITDLRHNGKSMGANVVNTSATSFELTGVEQDLLANSYIWIDGWDHTSTNTKFPEFEDVAISDRRLRIDIATASTALNTNISGLTNQLPYQVRVRARNSDGWGAWSSASGGTPLGVADAPANLASVSGNNQLEVSWSAPANNGGYAISDYDIQYRASTGTNTWGIWNDWQGSTVSTATSATINSGVVNGTKYQVRVRAVNSAGDGTWSAPITDSVGKPSQPTFALSTVQRPLPAGRSDRGGLLSMVLDAPANGSAVTDYDLRYRESGTTTWYTYRDRSLDSGRLSGSDTSSNTDPIDFGAFSNPSGAVGVVRESLGSGYVYKFSKAVDQLWIRASGTITGGGTVVAHWHTAKPTAAQVATLGTQIFSVNTSVNTEFDHTFWQDGWVTNLPANAYVWFYTTESETLTKRRLQLDFTDNTASPPQVNDTGTLTTSETVGLGTGNIVDPIDFGTFITPTGGVVVTRESVSGKAGYYKIGAAANLWIRVSGKLSVTGHARVIGCWSATKPTDPFVNCSSASNQVFNVVAQTVGGKTIFDESRWVYNLPANGYIWVYVEGLEVKQTARTLTEYRLQLDFDHGRIVLSGLQNGKTYELQARAKNARGWGAWSPSVTGTAGAPTRPVANTPTPKHQALAVTWNAPASNNNSAVTGYDVQYRAGSSGAWSSWPHAGTGRSATITGLTNNTEYQVQVRARNERGNSFWSAAAKATPVPQKPDAPAAPTLTSSGTTMTVAWAAPNANGADITDYDIEYSSDNGANWTEWNASNTSTALSASITNLVNGTTYQVRVRAENSVGTGEWSTTSTHTIGRPGAPSAPTLASGNAQLTANWSAPAGTVAITDYDVRYCSSSCDVDANWTSLPDTTDSTALSATIANLNNGTTYYVQVRAESSVGPGPWSPTASIKAGLPDVPSGIGVEPGNGGLNVFWTAASGNGSALIWYDFRYSSDGGTTWSEYSVDASLRSTTLTGLTNGVAHQVQLRSKNQHGAGPWSDVYTATPGTPDAPSAPTLTAGDHKLLVNWSAPGDNGSAITDYDVRYSANGGSSWSEWQPNTDSAANSAVITGLTPDTTYQVQVRATNTHGDSAWSASATHTLAVSPVPTLTFYYCDPGKLNQVWVDSSCFIKAGQHGTKPFNSARVASGGDYVELTDYISSAQTVVALGYNPNGGLAVIETLDSNNVVQDTFTIDVIRFQIRDTEITGTLKAMESSYLTVRLHSPDHGSPDKFAANGSDFARSWVQLDLPNELIAQDHNDTWQNDPIQVVDQHGDSVTFRMIPTSAGAFSIGIAAYRPAPDAGCPTEGELRCFQPPVDRLTKEYVAAAQVSAQAAFAAPNPPAAPANLAASAGDGSVTLSWDDPSNPSISGYEYNVNHNDTGTGNFSGWSDWQSIAGSDADTTSHTLSGLTNGREYRFHVRAVNAGGNGTAAPNAAPWYAAATPQEPPPPPATPGPVSSVTVTRADGTLTASWDAVDGATSYHVMYTSDNGASWQLAALNHTGTSITIDATNSDTYIVGVRARNSSGDSDWRDSPSAGPYTPPQTPTPPPSDPPATPSAVSVTRADGTLTASWDAPDGATKYHVTYSDDGGASWHAPVDDHTNVPTNSLTFSVDNAKSYIIGVRAGNDAGWSGWRNSPSAGPYTPEQTPAAPATPSAISVTRADGTLTASWDAPDGATKYHVTYSDDGGASWHAPVDDHTNVPTNSLSFSIDNAKTYIIGVRAGNDVGWSGWRNSPPAGP